MQPAVQAVALAFMRRFEGDVDDMYADVLDLVTTDDGNLIDSVAAAQNLPWLHRGTDVPATPDEIAAEWHAVKDGKIPAWKGPRPLYLSRVAMDDLANSRLLSNETFLAKRWSNWNDWPADAQLGAHSCTWAAGAGWHAPHFDAAVALLNFVLCSGPPGDAGKDPACRGEAWLNDANNPGLRPRNLANKVLFANAASVVALGLDPSILWYPSTASG